MGKGPAVARGKPEAPASLTLRLFDPGMSPIHRAGLGGLACTLKYIERAHKNGHISEKDMPGGPWNNGKPPWEIAPLQMTLHFGSPEGAGLFLKRLFACAFRLKDKLVFLPAQHRRDCAIAVLAELQNGLTLTFLQHGRVRQLAKTETPISYEINGQSLQVSVRLCSGYKHQDGWEELCTNGRLRSRPVEVVGPLNPGAVVRHVAFQALTRIEESPSLVLPLYFALVGCLAFSVNRGTGVLMVPEVADLVVFARVRSWMTPSGIRDCRVAGASDAVLQTQVRLAASRVVQSHELPGCYAATFRPTPWASQQKSRVDTVYVAPCDATRLQQYEIALQELPPRVVVYQSKKTKRSKKKIDASEAKDSGAFWRDSVVRPLVAENLARGRRWYEGFGGLARMAGKTIEYEKGGLNAMINKISWQDRGESAVVRAVHEAIRMRYGQIAEANKGKPVAMKNRWRGEYDRWRLAFAGAKTADQFRHSLCDLFGRAGINSVLRERWPELLPMLDTAQWQLTRDLSLLGLASYKGKGAEEGETAPAASDEEQGK